MTQYYEAVGRRKTATARVRIYPAGETVEFVVNDKPMEQFFTRLSDQAQVWQPLKELGSESRFNVSALVEGGGVTGQAEAVKMGLARALTAFDPNLRPPLKKAGFLVRDARAKERKKFGLKRARKAPQYTKR